MDNQTRHTFRKEERLCSRKTIEALFAGGNKSMSSYPIRVVCMPLSDETMPAFREQIPSVQVLISVSKRRFKHAVDRNRVKRLIREAYRKHKYLLTTVVAERGEHYALAFLWLSSEHVEAKVVEQKVCNLLQRVAESLPAIGE